MKKTQPAKKKADSGSAPTKLKTTRAVQQKLKQLSPFELKDKLINLADESSKRQSIAMLNAGRGNPNWTATTPREAFFTFGLFGIQECRRVLDKPGLAGIPEKKGIAKRLEAFIKENKAAPGADLLNKIYKYGLDKHKFNADDWVHELTEGIIGDQYPVPGRMLSHIETIVHDYLIQEMCARTAPKGKFDVFAVEGGTAAMCYIFDSLINNGLLKKGDKIALMLPTFTPYIEIPELDRYKFKVININASEVKDGRHTWQFPTEEIDKLSDTTVKALFVVNPTNPPSVAIRKSSVDRIVNIVKKMNPNLILITDDVYGTFVPGFRSLMADLPHNTIGVYSFSKYFGCTGWRLGVIAIHEQNVFDKMLQVLPVKEVQKLNKRYSTITLHPEKLKFIDRMVADSRQVALNHTAGLSLPQQVQMAFFSLSCLIDEADKYKKLTQDIVQQRLKLLWDNLGIELPNDPLRAGYYAELDLLLWAKVKYGPDFAKYLEKNYEPVDILFRLAERLSIVLLNGGGFGGPEWSIRVSLANLPTESYARIGKEIALIGKEYVDEWKKGI